MKNSYKIVLLLLAVMFSNIELIAAQEKQENQLTHRAADFFSVFLPAQNESMETFSFEFNETPLKEALDEMASRANLKILLNNSLVPKNHKVTGNLNHIGLSEAFDVVLEEAGLDYVYTGEGYIIIVPRVEAEEEQELQNTVSGRVVDAETGEALPGVNILIEGTTSGTTTNVDGNFELNVSSLDETLVFSYVGYISQQVNIDGRNEIIVELSPDIQMLEGLVVVGYGTQRKIEITSAVARVTEEDFNQGGVRSPLDLIQGRVAGLSITRTAGSNPNAGTARQLRGVTSLTGDLSPLVVIDGIPGGNMDLLQPSDIESFEVLKDGSAAAIYGTRANAGVILITTKKGQGGEPRYEYSSYIKHEMVAQKPDFLNASEYRDLIDQGLIGAGNDLGHSTDLYDELIDTGNLSQYHSFSASGGSENTNYRASFHYDDAYGIAKENSRSQFGGRLNVNQIGLDGRLLLQANLVTNFNRANLLGGGGGDFEQAIQRNPTAPIIADDGSFVETEAFNNYNPLSQYAFRENERDQQTFSGDLKGTLNITEGLGVTVFGAYVRDSFNDRYYVSSQDFSVRPETDYQGMGHGSKSNYLHWNSMFETIVDYNTDFSRDHSLDLIGGYSYQYFTTETFNVSNSGFTTDSFKDWNLGAGTAINNTTLPRPSIGSGKSDNTLIAFFGRTSYSYVDKYFAQVTLRYEGSSRFGDNNKWGAFPAVSVGWVLSDEDFMRSLDMVNFLKFRLGYGVTGNQGIGNYQSLVTLSTGGVYPQEGVFYQTYGAARNPNPNLRWEKKREWNFGIDFALFNDKVSGEIDIYQRETVDLLHNYTAQQPPFVRNSIYTNVGSIENKGVELYLNTSVIERMDASWTMDFTANSQFNKLTSLSDEVYTLSWLEFGGLPSPGNLGNAIRLEEGGRVGNFYGKSFAGFTDEGRWLFYKADGSVAPVSEIDDEDLGVIGNGVPKYMMSWANNFRYKNFDLTIFFRGKFGFDILNTQEMYFGNQSWLPNNLLKSAITTHSELNDNPQYSDYYLEKGDFVKLDNVTLGYTFNPINDYIRNLRVYISGRNLLTFTGYSGLDPELADTGFTTGIDNRGFYPRTRSFTVGLNLEF